MNTNPTNTEMARLVRIETKLSVFMQEAKNRFNDIEQKINQLQDTLDEVYPEEDEGWGAK